MFTNLEKKIKTSRRRLASHDGCMVDLETELPLLFKAFHEAYGLFEEEIIQTPPEARARGFEASLLNSKMIQSIQKHFPLNCKFGKYKRFILRINGYTILFKKLGNNGMPMNIKTNHSNAISQQLSFSLFENASYIADPILFFGYKKDKTGEISDPQLVYIDENHIKWTVTENDITKVKTRSINKPIPKAVPRLRAKAKNKTANN